MVVVVFGIVLHSDVLTMTLKDGQEIWDLQLRNAVVVEGEVILFLLPTLQQSRTLQRSLLLHLPHHRHRHHPTHVSIPGGRNSMVEGVIGIENIMLILIVPLLVMIGLGLVTFVVIVAEGIELYKKV